MAIRSAWQRTPSRGGQLRFGHQGAAVTPGAAVASASASPRWPPSRTISAACRSVPGHDSVQRPRQTCPIPVRTALGIEKTPDTRSRRPAAIDLQESRGRVARPSSGWHARVRTNAGRPMNSTNLNPRTRPWSEVGPPRQHRGAADQRAVVGGRSLAVGVRPDDGTTLRIRNSLEDRRIVGDNPFRGLNPPRHIIIDYALRGLCVCGIYTAEDQSDYRKERKNLLRHSYYLPLGADYSLSIVGVPTTYH